MRQFNIVRGVLLALGVGAAGAASAFGPGDRVVSTGFGVSEAMGRAWVEVVYQTQLFEDIGPQMTKVAIDGLRYDAERRAVVQNVAGQDVVCATARDSGFGPFRGTRVTPTGACEIATKPTVARLDNGFTVREVPQLAVELNVLPARTVLAGTAQLRAN